MPLIRIDFNQKVQQSEVETLSEAVQKIVAEATGIEDVFVYADSPQLQVKTAPIEIFIQMSQEKIKDSDQIVSSIKSGLAEWKQQTNFPHLINFTLIPMNWKIELGI